MPLQARDKPVPYEIVALLGNRGMGEVYRAKETKPDSQLTIQAFLAALADNTERTARFERDK